MFAMLLSRVLQNLPFGLAPDCYVRTSPVAGASSYQTKKKEYRCPNQTK